MINALFIVMIAIIITGVSQIFLKKGAGNGIISDKFYAPYINVSTITAYGLLFLVTILTVYALREIPLKVFYALSSLNFVVVLMLSVMLLGEKIGKNEVLAVLLIVCGIIIFNLQ